MNATHLRSREISDDIVAYLTTHGPTRLTRLAAHVGSHPNTISASRVVYNLRLACSGQPHRIHTRQVRGRVVWFLAPSLLTQQSNG